MTLLRSDERIFLRYDDELTTSVKAILFGEMVRKVSPHVNFYLSDYYHDVHWIDENIKAMATFYYGCRDTGTSLGTDRDLVVANNKRAWKIDLIQDPKKAWQATFQEIVF